MHGGAAHCDTAHVPAAAPEAVPPSGLPVRLDQHRQLLVVVAAALALGARQVRVLPRAVVAHHDAFVLFMPTTSFIRETAGHYADEQTKSIVFGQEAAAIFRCHNTDPLEFAVKYEIYMAVKDTAACLTSQSLRGHELKRQVCLGHAMLRETRTCNKSLSGVCMGSIEGAGGCCGALSCCWGSDRGIPSAALP